MASDRGALGKETDVAGVRDEAEASGGEGPGELPLSLGADDDVEVTREDEGGNIDPVESGGDVVGLEGAKASGHDGLVGFPATLDDELGEGAGLGSGAVEEVEELVDELTVGGKREPLEDPSGQAGNAGLAEGRLDAVEDEGAGEARLIGGQLEGDGTAVRDAEDHRPLEAEAVEQVGDVTSLLGDVTRTKARGDRVIAGVADEHDRMLGGELLGQREQELPAAGQPGQQDDRVAAADPDNLHRASAGDADGLADQRKPIEMIAEGGTTVGGESHR